MVWSISNYYIVGPAVNNNQSIQGNDNNNLGEVTK
jgi:hypothetical protein